MLDLFHKPQDRRRPGNDTSRAVSPRKSIPLIKDECDLSDPGPRTLTIQKHGQRADLPFQQRDRSHSRRRSRSPRRDRRRSYDSRSRSRSRGDYRRDERRSRSPINGAAGGAGYSSTAYPTDRGAAGAPPARNFEDRSANKDQMMSNVRESSQQDRRVYVGNLSYDVKWHHLKDFMRQGDLDSPPQVTVY